MSNVCLTDLKEATQKFLSKKDADNLIKEIEDRARVKAENGLQDVNEALERSASDIFDEQKHALLIKKKNALINMRIYKAVNDYLKEFPEEIEGLRAFLHGIQSDIEGSRDSTALAQKINIEGLIGRLLSELKKNNVLSVFNDKGLEEELAEELYQEGSSKNPHIKTTARVIRDTYEIARKKLNASGADIGSLDSYIARQTHNIEKLTRPSESFKERLNDRFEAWKRFKSFGEVRKFLREKAFNRWKIYILPRLDSIKSFQGADPEEFLKSVYEALISGVHMKASTPEETKEIFKFTGPANKAKKLSSHRLLHFKDGKSWFEYNKKYGEGSVQNSVLRTIRTSGRDLGLMQKWGTNPRAMFDRVLREVQERNRLNPKVKKLNQLKNVFDELDGTTSIPVNHLAAKIGAAIRMNNSLSMLGGLLLSSQPDLAIKASALREHGLGALDAYSQSLNDLIKGRPKGEVKQIADALNVWSSSQMGHLTAYFSTWDAPGGFTTKMMQKFFKLTGMEWWDEVNRTGFATFISRKLALQRETTFQNLSEGDQRLLGLYGIGGKEWDLVRSQPMKLADNRLYVTPDMVDNFSDESIAGYLGKDVNELKPHEIESVKNDIQDRLQSYFIDQTDNANIQHSAVDKALIIRGTKPGTLWGEVARFVGQFKYFNLAFSRRVFGRLLYGHGAENLYDAIINGKGDITGLAQLIAGSTILGYLSMSSKNLVSGLEPRNPADPKTWLASMLQGGGLGIYGDFLFGEYNRFGHGLLTTVLGPTASTVKQLGAVFADLRDGQDPTNALFWLAKGNTPFINLFYTRAALDYLILYDLQERISPGSVERMQHKIEQENHQQFWFPPSQYRLGAQ